MTAIARQSVSEVLATMNAEFAPFVAGFCDARYILWIGSGVSRDVVPGLFDLLVKVLEFVRSKIDHTDRACPYLRALNEILDIGSVPKSIREKLDIAAPVDEWPDLEDIVGRLSDRYEKVLNVQVNAHDPDYLVWEAVDPARTYGDPTLVPDSEHLCIAILMLEGVVRFAPTTNWDGLVEAAMARLTGDAAAHIRVVVLPGDLRGSDARPELVKFHGCAVLAAQDESIYRSKLVARALQISTWGVQSENQLMVGHLSKLFTTFDALFVGLSAQDANIQSFFGQGIASLDRSWPVTPPAVVFAEETLQHNHELVLQVVYGATFSDNRTDIEASALLGAYAKPVLIALVLVVLAEKFCVWISAAFDALFSEDQVERIRADLRSLRDIIGVLAKVDDPRSFVDALIEVVSFALIVFREGRKPDPVTPDYRPISTFPATEAHRQPDFPAPAFGRFGVALSVFGRGLAEGRWSLFAGSPVDPSDGVVRVMNDRGVSRIFVVSDARAMSQLEIDGVIDLRDADLVVVIAKASQVPATRSPLSVFGRTGFTGARQVDLEGVCSTVKTADELFEAFTLEAAI